MEISWPECSRFEEVVSAFLFITWKTNFHFVIQSLKGKKRKYYLPEINFIWPSPSLYFAPSLGPNEKVKRSKESNLFCDLLYHDCEDNPRVFNKRRVVARIFVFIAHFHFQVDGTYSNFWNPPFVLLYFLLFREEVKVLLSHSEGELLRKKLTWGWGKKKVFENYVTTPCLFWSLYLSFFCFFF